MVLGCKISFSIQLLRRIVWNLLNYRTISRSSLIYCLISPISILIFIAKALQIVFAVSPIRNNLDKHFQKYFFL